MILQVFLLLAAVVWLLGLGSWMAYNYQRQQQRKRLDNLISEMQTEARRKRRILDIMEEEQDRERRQRCGK